MFGRMEIIMLLKKQRVLVDFYFARRIINATVILFLSLFHVQKEPKFLTDLFNFANETNYFPITQLLRSYFVLSILERQIFEKYKVFSKDK